MIGMYRAQSRDPRRIYMMERYGMRYRWLLVLAALILMTVWSAGSVRAACDHGYGPGEMTVAPGCETEGVLRYTCSLCGDSYTETIPAMGHSFGCVRTEPDCQTEGSLLYTCEGCGDSYSEPIPALGHGYVLDRTQVFCDKDGLAVNVCTACGHSYSEPLPAMGHSYACVRREPSCEEDGALVYTCAGCGDSYSEPIPALDHDYESQLLEVFCDREGREVLVCTTCGDSFEELIPPMGHRYESVWKDPSCEEAGGEVHTCENCGDSYTDVVPAMGHSFAEGICGVCGEADPDWVADPGLVLGYPTLSFEDEVIYNVYYTVEDMTSVVEMGLMLLPKLDQEATIEDATALVPGFVTNGVAYLVNSGGIPAARMGQTVYFKVYAKLTDGSYAYSAAGGYNAKAYANSILSGDSSDDMKRLVVAMLEYGAEAQRYFGQDDVLMDGSLTEEHRALVEAYDASMMDDVVKADPAKTGNFLRDNANFRSLYPSVSFDGAFAINVYCVPAVAVDGKMTMYWWDVETMESVEALNVDNAVGSMEMTASSGIWWGQMAGIAAKEMDKTYYMSCVFESGGETVTTGVIAYSLGKYCEGKAATEGDPQQDFAKATAVYGYYAKRYFENND